MAGLTVTTTAAADTVGTAARAGTGRPSGLLARSCAAVAVAAVGAHLWMAWEHRAVPWQGVLMLLMAAVCLPCAVEVWRRGHGRAVQLLYSMALAMVAVHALLLLAPRGAGGHQHGGTASMGAGSVGAGSVGAGGGLGDVHAGTMLAVIGLELAVAMMAAWAMRRSRACQEVPAPAPAPAEAGAGGGA